MIAAFIVLLAVAVALGGYIAFDVLHGKKQTAIADAGKTAERVATDIPRDTEEIVSVAEETEAPNIKIAETDDDRDDEITRITPVAENGRTRYIVIKYSKSFLAKLIQSDDETKRYYSAVKNRLLSYNGVKSRIAWKWESFRSGRKTLAKLRLRGKTLSICLALDPENRFERKYNVESLADIKAYAATPCMCRIKNERRLRCAEELIAELMMRNGITEKPREKTDYAEIYAYETTDALIARKLIKVLTDRDAQRGTAFEPSDIRGSVTAQEVDGLMRDEVAATLIEKSDVTSDRTKTGIVNIDTLSANFESGEVVTLDEIKKRVKGFNKQTTYIKVLARGTLDKALTVEADGFSLQAVKMIVLTGGTAVRKR